MFCCSQRHRILGGAAAHNGYSITSMTDVVLHTTSINVGRKRHGNVGRCEDGPRPKRRRIDNSSKSHRWQLKAEGKLMHWLDMGIDESDQLERAFVSGEPRHTATLVDDGTHHIFRKGDPQTLTWITDFKSCVSWCEEFPARRIYLQRVACDVAIAQCQRQTLATAYARSAVASQRAMEHVERRVARLLGKPANWSTSYPLRTWLQNDAPFIIHVDFEKMFDDGSLVIDKFLLDDHYRNIFETGHGGGSTHLEERASWEEAMFGSAYPYPRGTAAVDRPKYGTVNLTDDPRGVVTAQQYGKSYFVLSKSLRWRTTLTSMDSSEVGVPGTVGMVYKFLDSYSDEDFEKIFRRTKRYWTSILSLPDPLPYYPEIQVHGPVKLNRDIHHLVADSNLSNEVQAKVKEFGRQNKFRVIWRSL